MEPETCWAVYDSENRELPWTRSATRRGSLTHLFDYSRTTPPHWAWYYARGYRCLRVTVTPTSGDTK